ncbi:MAG: hypothetical protein AAGF11_51105 [Myxococcota bacterium]
MTEQGDPGRLIREQIDARLNEAAPMPDLVDVFARASRLQGDELDQLDDEHVLAPFIEAYVEMLDRELEGLQPGQAPERPEHHRGAWVAALAAAAAVVLVVGVLSWLDGARRWMVEVLGDSGQEAQHEVLDGGSEDEGTFSRPRPRSRGSHTRSGTRSGTRTHSLPDSAAAEEAAGDEADVEQVEQVEQVEPVEPVEPVAQVEQVEPEPSPRAARRPSRDERLAELDAQAQAAWRRGDLRTAERRYRAIVKLGGRREVAELAYGELFAIVRQRGGSLTSLWRAYLRRFPRGRYAEDVEAGLCRRAGSDEREACWARYRRRYPNGIHGP